MSKRRHDDFAASDLLRKATCYSLMSVGSDTPSGPSTESEDTSASRKRPRFVLAPTVEIQFRATGTRDSVYVGITNRGTLTPNSVEYLLRTIGSALDTVFAARGLAGSITSQLADKSRRQFDTKLTEQTIDAVCARRFALGGYEMTDLGNRCSANTTCGSVTKDKRGHTMEFLDDLNTPQKYRQENPNCDSENQPTPELLSANFQHTRDYLKSEFAGEELGWTIEERCRAEGTASIIAETKPNGMDRSEWLELRALEAQVEFRCPSGTVSENSCGTAIVVNERTASCTSS